MIYPTTNLTERKPPYPICASVLHLLSVEILEMIASFSVLVQNIVNICYFVSHNKMIFDSLKKSCIFVI